MNVKVNEPMFDDEGDNPGPQTHCPGCGVHRDACVNPTTFTAVDGHPAWKCAQCINSVQQQVSVPRTLIRCPACCQTQLIAQCGLCRSIGSVFVPTSEIAQVSLKNVPGMLIEG